MATTYHTDPPSPTGPPGRFFDLVERLIGEVATLLDKKLDLLTLELKTQGAALVQGVIALLAGVALASVGLLLLAIAAAVWIGTRINSIPGGYGIVGAALVVLGAVLMVAMRSRLSATQLAPRESVRELRRDAKWITDEL
jgi:uncharacterized membrane protein YqjE